MINIKIDLHIHTKYSADCNTEPKNIAKVELLNGVACIAVTDHNRFSSFSDFKMSGIKLIKGEEISTDKGHLIGLFLEDAIKSREFFAACDEIHSQGAIAILPHPFRSHNKPESLVRSVDIVEVFNARTSVKGNEQAYDLAYKAKKPRICGSDAHFLSELGRCVAEVNTDDVHEARKMFMKGKISMDCVQSPFYAHPLTWFVKGRKIFDHFAKK